MWNTFEVEEMIADNSSGFGYMNGLVADEAGGIVFKIFIFYLKNIDFLTKVEWEIKFFTVLTDSN